ncbi:glycoside hydrolase family 27 protein [Trametes maxima]|nr:glycoside hydrolase family 27 protein [Trametes maxima]
MAHDLKPVPGDLGVTAPHPTVDDRKGDNPGIPDINALARRRVSLYGITLRPSSTLLVGSLALLLASSLSAWTLFSAEPRNVQELDIRVAKLPVLGYNTWNAYHCDINETIVLQDARLLVSLGLADLGYTQVNIDDCYSEKNRSASGDIVADKLRFPSGMNNLTDQIHALGLKAGIYSDSGWFTCQLYPGSDAKLFQDWGFDYLKFDNCAIPYDEIIREGIVGSAYPHGTPYPHNPLIPAPAPAHLAEYKRMADAIAQLSQESGKPPLIFSLCEWGEEQPWLWARRYGQSWRTTGDISPNWGSITDIINQNSFIAWASDFYGHNDMDILEVGNGDLTYEEAKTHFTAWALMKSPLLIGTDLSKIRKRDLSILKNQEILAISQDPVVGTSVTPFRWGINPDWVSNRTHPAQFWSGESQNGTVFMLINTLDHPADLSFSLTESPWIRAGRQYAVRDLWTHTANGTAVRNFTAHHVPAHGVVALLLTDAGDEPPHAGPPCARPAWCISRNGTLVPGA